MVIESIKQVQKNVEYINTTLRERTENMKINLELPKIF